MKGRFEVWIVDMKTHKRRKAYALDEDWKGADGKKVEQPDLKFVAETVEAWFKNWTV